VGEAWKASEETREGSKMMIVGPGWWFWSAGRLGELDLCDLFVDLDFKTVRVEPELLYGTIRKIMLSTRDRLTRGLLKFLEC
jgi:hypothetical protein